MPGQGFNRSVQLPPGLTLTAIKKAIHYVERELPELIDIYFEQANVFSAVVGIYGTRALHSYSEYEKHKNIDTAQQRFPDLKRRGSGPNPRPNESLESKGSKRPWAVQSHYDHPGWYMIWRYFVDPTESFETGKTVILWRVDVTFIEKSDWKYEGSKASQEGGGRTHTFGLKRPSRKLAGKAAFERIDIRLAKGKPVPINGGSEEA